MFNENEQNFNLNLNSNKDQLNLEFNLLQDDPNDLKDKIKIQEVKLNDKDKIIKYLSEELEKSKKEILSNRKNNKNISESFFNNHKFSQILNEIKHSKISDLVDLADNFDKNELFKNVEKEINNLFDLEYDIFSLKISEKIILLKKENEKLISEYKEKIEKITNELNGITNLPRNILQETIKPLEKQISQIYENNEKLEILKSKFMDFNEVDEI